MKHNVLAIPKPEYMGGFDFEWVKISDTCLLHKQYPICLKCDNRFVPIDKGDECCFKCKIVK